MRLNGYRRVVGIGAILLAGSCLARPALSADIDSLLEAMTLEEKLGMLHGGQDPRPEIGLGGAGYVAGVPRLGIPPLRMADGPAGIRTNEPATALPAPIGLAASFDPGLAYRYGQVIGLEGKARNQAVLLSPMVNIVRVPHAGRNFETLGEDPLLAGEMVAGEIRGIQDEGLMATVKHYVANNQEDSRFSINALVGQRAMREIYLPGFEAAVDAGVAAVMCAYNRVNDRYSCENPQLLNGVLRGDFGFEGYVMTDWWAIHGPDALLDGLNLEMPGYEVARFEQNVWFGDRLKQAIDQGLYTEAHVDDALRPMLRQMDRFGLLDDAEREAAEIDRQAHARVALETALRGAVLLKNDEDALPLTDDDLNDLLVLGPTARSTLIGGGGSSRVLPFHRDSPLDSLRALAPGAEISWLSGVDLDGSAIPARYLRGPDGEQTGLVRHQDDGGQTVDDTIDFPDSSELGEGGAWTWEGRLEAPEDGRYELMIQVRGGTGRLMLDGETVAESDSGILSQASLIPTLDGLRNGSRSLELEGGRAYVLRVEGEAFSDALFTPEEDFGIRLAWLTPSQRRANLEQAAERAREASAVVVFAYVEGTEGGDRESLALPGYQDALIEAVADAAPRKLVVVLNVGAPVTMPWLAQTDAILQMWYPGQEGGRATASLLLGHENPSGKLPVTFPRRESDIATPDARQYPGVNGLQVYSEGIFVGYRWYDEMNIDPLFPFGHGLSYTRFDWSELRIETGESGDAGQSEVSVSFTVRNSGQRAGIETPQVYISHAGEAPVPMAERQLAAFTRVALAPGESRRVTLDLAPRAFEFWDEEGGRWRRLAGPKVVRVGASSRDLLLTGEFTLRQ